jgi:hypothetical protein
MKQYEKPVILATYSAKELADEAARCTFDGYGEHSGRRRGRH